MKLLVECRNGRFCTCCRKSSRIEQEKKGTKRNVEIQPVWEAPRSKLIDTKNYGLRSRDL